MDFKDSFVTVANERFTEQLQCTAKVRNRSDHRIRGFDLTALVTRTDGGLAGTGTAGPGGRINLATGQETEISVCGGRGTGGAPGNQVRLVIFVSAVAMDGCSYIPSRRFPHSLGLS